MAGAGDPPAAADAPQSIADMQAYYDSLSSAARAKVELRFDAMQVLEAHLRDGMGKEDALPAMSQINSGSARAQCGVGRTRSRVTAKTNGCFALPHGPKARRAVPHPPSVIVILCV